MYVPVLYINIIDILILTFYLFILIRAQADIRYCKNGSRRYTWRRFLLS